MKLFLAPLPNNAYSAYTCPRTRHLIRQGLSKLNVEIVELEDSADFIIFDYVPHEGTKKYYKDNILKYNPKKLIVIDNSDEPDVLYTEEYYAYFKRSLFNTNQDYTRSECELSKRNNIFWFDYAILDEFIKEPVEKSIDVGCYLRPSCGFRSYILQLCNNLNIKNKVVGEVSSGSRHIDFNIYTDDTYFNYINSTKIIITAQPFGWVSDSRLYEALANRCVVFTDKIYINHNNKFIDKKHIFEYEFNNTSLQNMIDSLFELLQNEQKIKEISNESYEFAVQHHSSKARMQYVLETIRSI